MNVAISVKNIDGFAKALNGSPILFLHNLNEAIKNATDWVFQTAKDEYIIGGKGYRKAPFQTGQMYLTMRRDIIPLQGRIYPTVDYAESVHEGTGTSSSYGRRPFLEDALKDGEKGFIKDEIHKAIEKSLDRIAIDARTGQ